VSGLGEAFAALKNVMLLHERVEDVQKELERLAGEQKELNRAVVDIDKRVIRIETMIEMSTRRTEQPPRIER
jgi:predicted  nucleic acid-binding Zn-ribbon protein